MAVRQRIVNQRFQSPMMVFSGTTVGRGALTTKPKGEYASAGEAGAMEGFKA